MALKTTTAMAGGVVIITTQIPDTEERKGYFYGVRFIKPSEGGEDILPYIPPQEFFLTKADARALGQYLIEVTQ